MPSLHRSNKQQEKEAKFERIQTEHIKSKYLLCVALNLPNNEKLFSPWKHLKFTHYENFTNFLSQITK